MNEMKEGISETMQETMQDMTPAAHPKDSSNLDAAFDKHTSQNDAVREEQPVEQASIKILTDGEEQATEHVSDMDIDKHGSKEIAQESRLEGVDQTVEHICQQVGDSEVAVSMEGDDAEKMGDDAEKIADKSTEGDGGLSAGNHAQEEEGVDIREGDLIETVMEVFESRQVIETRPIPVLVRGKEVDLVQLSFQVRACGGYDQVTSWSSIAKSLGFGQECGPLIKLVYVKYLKSLEGRRLVVNQGVQGSSKRENEESVKSESFRGQVKSRGATSTRKRSSEDGLTIDATPMNASAASLAEGSESLIAVLEWVKRLALNPGDPKKGQGVRVSRCSEAWAGKCEALASRMREVLWKKHEHLLHDLLPSEIQDEESDGKKRGKGQQPHIKGAGKKARRSSS